MLRSFREFLQWRQGDSIILAEANVVPKENLQYFGDDGDRMQMMFNFHVNQSLFYAMASADVRPLAKAMNDTKERPATGQWGIFLRNHDELDLGRLTDKQRQTVFDKMGPDKDMQLYDRGIRRRLAPMLGDPRQLRLAYSVMFSLPGTPVIRYGDEIGMGEDLSLAERAAVPRTGYTLAMTESSGPPFGSVGIYRDGPHHAEMGFAVSRDRWGQGYATEAARAVLEFGFADLGVRRIWATCRPENVGSCRVLEKIGMIREGHLREHVLIRGRWVSVPKIAAALARIDGVARWDLRISREGTL